MAFSTFRSKLLSLLVEQFETSVPQFKPYTVDYQMVVYACKDLETWLKVKWQVDDYKQLFEKLEVSLKDDPRDFGAFLSFWACLWLEKWRERVKVLSTKPEMPPNYMDKVKEARKLYLEMDHKKELKRMVAGKLLSRSEICMVELIAEATYLSSSYLALSYGEYY